MNRKWIARERALFIILGLIFMTATVIVVGQALQGDQVVTKSEQRQATNEPVIPQEAGAFAGLNQASRMEGADPQHERNLIQFYSNRAYPGAPPMVPHPIEFDMSINGQKDCLSCHREGGYVMAFNAYAPITPHPEKVNCRQCHVPAANTTPLFKETNWEKMEPPPRGRAAIAGGPLPVPHDLQMRENCSACHTGPAAVSEIRSSHPERINCRQCHVPAKAQSIFQR